MRRVVEKVEDAVDIDEVEAAFLDADLVDKLGIGNEELHVACREPVLLNGMRLALTGIFNEGFAPVDTDDAALRAHVIGKLVGALAATADKIEHHLGIETAGNEHIAAAVETAILGNLRIMCFEIV